MKTVYSALMTAYSVLATVHPVALVRVEWLM
jgi:hypothetical protein